LKNRVFFGDAMLAAFLGFFLVLLLTKHSGLGISPDSIYYLSAADSLLAGNGLYQFDDKPFIMFPFFYPCFLAIVQGLFHLSILKAGAYLNASLFGVVIYMSGIMLADWKVTPWLRWLLLLLMALSPSLLEIYTMLWSETLFVVEIMAGIFLARKYFKETNYKNLFFISIISAIIIVTRLAGLAFAGTIGLLILMNHDAKWGTKIKHAIIYGFCSIVLLVLNLLRNSWVSATLTGNRQKGTTPFLDNLEYYGTVLSSWLPFSEYTSKHSILLALIFLGIVFILFLYRWLQKKEHNSYEKITVAFTLVYSVFMLITATVSRFETINNRLLSPFFIPCLFTLSFYVVGALKSIQHKFAYTFVKIIIIVVGLATLGEYAKKDFATYQENSQGGIGGYTEDDWICSETIAYLKKDSSIWKQGQPLYSNASHAVYFFTKNHLSILPERKYQDLVKEFTQSPKLQLIWFKNEDNPEILNLAEIKAVKNLELLKEFKDGYIFKCTSK
jgi:hypothetical protein